MLTVLKAGLLASLVGLGALAARSPAMATTLPGLGGPSAASVQLAQYGEYRPNDGRGYGRHQRHRRNRHRHHRRHRGYRS